MLALLLLPLATPVVASPHHPSQVGSVSEGAPLLLVEPEGVPRVIADVLSARPVDRLIVLGGRVAVGEATFDCLDELLMGSVPTRVAGRVYSETMRDVSLVVAAAGVADASHG